MVIINSFEKIISLKINQFRDLIIDIFNLFEFITKIILIDFYFNWAQPFLYKLYNRVCLLS